jgi:flagellar hook-length control protein FliK
MSMTVNSRAGSLADATNPIDRASAAGPARAASTSLPEDGDRPRAARGAGTFSQHLRDDADRSRAADRADARDAREASQARQADVAQRASDGPDVTATEGTNAKPVKAEGAAALAASPANGVHGREAQEASAPLVIEALPIDALKQALAAGQGQGASPAPTDPAHEASPSGQGEGEPTDPPSDGAHPSALAQSLLAQWLPPQLPVVMPVASLVQWMAYGPDAGAHGNGAESEADLSRNGARGAMSALSGSLVVSAASGTSALSVSAVSAASSLSSAAGATGAGGGALAIDARPAAPSDPSAWMGLPRWSAEWIAAAASAGAGSDAAPTLALPADRSAWQQPLLQALGERLQLQLVQRSDQARLHLAPPQLGRIEIDIRQQGGTLQIQFHATHDEVRQQLRQIAEPLRHELVQRHSGEVSVQVASGGSASADGRGREGFGGQSSAGGQSRDAQRQPGRALGDDETATGASAASVAFSHFGDALAGHGPA